MKQGLSLIINFVFKSKEGSASVIDAAAVLPATSTCTCPDLMALSVAALSPNLVIFAPFGALAVSSRSSRVPPVTPTVKPSRSSYELILILDAENTPEKNGA